MDNPTFTLSRATTQDVPQLARLAAAAFRHDAHTQLKAAAQPPGAFEAAMAAGLAQWLRHPERCVVLKAVDDSNSNRIAGFVSWAFRGGVPVPELPPPAPTTTTVPPTIVATEEEEEEEEEEEPVSEPTNAEKEEGNGRSSPSETPDAAAAVDDDDDDDSSQQQQQAAALERRTDAHLAAFRARVMPAPDTRCLYVGALAVAPAAQGRGLGARLLRWGTERADADAGGATFCWAHASPRGWRLFARAGFAEADALTLDLDEYAGAEAKRRWGRYTFRYGVRRPTGTRREGI
ncbi:acyl-CoA N-acyltransferase [Xylariomycetidae sp. FL0641]|nr:acyl-CoA N-acyltransferase [Xylariomycetidae sp. FL0641]